MIRTIIFDLGGVLVDFHPVEGMKKLGFSEEAVESFKKNIFSGLWEKCDEKPLEDYAIRKLFKEAVPGFEKEVDLLWDNITAVTGVYDYSCAWIKELKERGYQIYILSNFGQRAFEVNSQLYTFLGDVDGKVISYEVKMIKPDAGIYHYLSEKYHLNPKEAVFIDDRKVNVDGARACGFQGIVFDNYEQARKELEYMMQRE
ncbi:MAG: HAD family phosphatase [Thermoflexaceae bacterium]|nr:HAD family phosphatase [Thermoflexaceae bacterium]